MRKTLDNRQTFLMAYRLGEHGVPGALEHLGVLSRDSIGDQPGARSVMRRPGGQQPRSP